MQCYQHTSRSALFLAAILCFAFVVPFAHAALFQVPQDYSTIQAAIDAAPGVVGDTVLVAPGYYREALRISNKQLVLLGQFALDNNPATIMATVIDGSVAAGQDTSSTICWQDVPGTTSEIRGFTIIGGGGSLVWDTPISAWAHEGGGILVTSWTVQDGYLTIADNVIRDNTVEQYTGSLPANNGAGGMSIWWTDVTVERNVFYNNYAYDYSGAFAMNYNVSSVHNNLFMGNRLGNNAYRGTICYYWNSGSDEPVENNTFVQSSVDNGQNTLFFGYQSGTPIEFRNNLFFEEASIFEAGAGSSGLFSYNLSINTQLPGTGNVMAVPTFEEWGSFILSDSSPGVDQGDPSLFDVEDPEHAQFALWPAKGTTASDMGAYGGSGMPLGGFPDYSQSLAVDEPAASPDRPVSFTLSAVYPNPFNLQTTVVVDLATRQKLNVAVYDVLGRLVNVISNETRPAGRNLFTLGSSGWSSGQYFVRVSVPGQGIQVRKMVFLK